MKRFVIRTLLLWCFVLLIVSLASAEDQTTNASLSRYNFNGRGSHWILIPDDVSKYAYLGHYPVTAFVFLDYYNSYNKIDDITIKQLMSGTIGNVFKGTNVILAFSKLKGLEDIPDELEGLDEFGVSSKKNEIINKFKDTYKKYLTDYQNYSKGTYTFSNLLVYNNGAEDDNNYFPDHITLEYPIEINFEQNKITRKNYDFDKKILSLPDYIGPNSGDPDGWGARYANNYYKMYNKPLPRDFKMPLTIDNAKKLFGDQQEVFCETLITVKPRLYPIFICAYDWCSANFDIIKITKRFYRKDTGFTEPVLVFEIELKGNNSHPNQRGMQQIRK